MHKGMRKMRFWYKIKAMHTGMRKMFRHEIKGMRTLCVKKCER